MQNKSFHLFAPRYWLIWIVLGILRLLIKLPFKLQLRIGRQLGRGLMFFSSKIRRTAETNIKLCFPELGDADRQALLRKNFESIGIAVFETVLGWWGSEYQLRAIKTTLNGFEHLESALQKGKGVMLCSPHFTTLELAGRLFTLKTPFAVMYRPQKNPLLEYITRRALERHYETVIPRHDKRGMLRYLKQNKIVWYAPDIDAGIKNSVFVPYFGILAASITATSRYANISQAAVVPAFFYRRDNGYYEVIIKPALDHFPSGNLEADTLRINQAFEEAIRLRPEQYLWQYKRFKTRPFGEKRFYK